MFGGLFYGNVKRRFGKSHKLYFADGFNAVRLAQQLDETVRKKDVFIDLLLVFRGGDDFAQDGVYKAGNIFVRLFFG